MGRFKEIYDDPQWEPARQEAIRRANGLCVTCFKRGIIKPGKEVDHIVELTEENKDDWYIAFNPNNLEYKCTDCHNEKHERSIGLQKFLIPPNPPHPENKKSF